MRTATKTHSKTRIVEGSGGGRRTRGHGRRKVPGGNSPRAVVVIVTLNGAGEAPPTLTDDAEVLQVDCAGAPEQARLTAPVKPETGFT